MNEPLYGKVGYPTWARGQTYLGWYEWERGRYDLWHIKHGDGRLDLIARGSKRRWDYYEGMVVSWQQSNDHPLTEARIRAQMFGLDCMESRYDPNYKKNAPKKEKYEVQHIVTGTAQTFTLTMDNLRDWGTIPEGWG